MTRTKDEIAQRAKMLEEETKRLAQEKEMHDTIQYRKRLQDARLANDSTAIEEKRAKGSVPDERGNLISLWDKLKQETDRALKSEQYAYNDWRSAMMSLLILYSSMVDAVNQSVEEKLLPLYSTAKQAIRERLISVKDKMLDTLRGDPRIDLPALIHDVTMSDDNKLDFVLARSDKGEDMGSLNEDFQALVSAWLIEQGYEPAADNTYVQAVANADGTKPLLTKERFEELKSSEDHGLAKFLGENVNLEFRQARP